VVLADDVVGDREGSQLAFQARAAQTKHCERVSIEARLELEADRQVASPDRCRRETGDTAHHFTAALEMQTEAPLQDAIRSGLNQFPGIGCHKVPERKNVVEVRKSQGLDEAKSNQRFRAARDR